MTQLTNKFVFAKNDISVSGSVIHKNEIGIVESKSIDFYPIYLIRIDKELKLSTNDFTKYFEFFDINNTGDAYPKKVCNVCHRLLDTSEFSRNQNGINNRPVRRPSCDECRITIDGVGLSAEDKRKWEEKRPQFVRFECPICKKITIPGLNSKVVLDHDHNTGRVRGWICDSCNTGLGRFKDDVNLLKSAINFLETK